MLDIMKENGLRAFVLLVLLSFTTPSLLFANNHRDVLHSSSVKQEISDQSAVHEQFKKERISHHQGCGIISRGEAVGFKRAR